MEGGASGRAIIRGKPNTTQLRLAEGSRNSNSYKTYTGKAPKDLPRTEREEVRAKVRRGGANIIDCLTGGAYRRTTEKHKVALTNKNYMGRQERL